MAAAEMADYRLSNEAMARRIQRCLPMASWPEQLDAALL